jgi:hypothetical protein
VGLGIEREGGRSCFQSTTKNILARSLRCVNKKNGCRVLDKMAKLHLSQPIAGEHNNTPGTQIHQKRPCSTAVSFFLRGTSPR